MTLHGQALFDRARIWLETVEIKARIYGEQDDFLFFEINGYKFWYGTVEQNLIIDYPLQPGERYHLSNCFTDVTLPALAVWVRRAREGRLQA